MTLLRIASATMVFAGAFLGMVDWSQAAMIGIVLILAGFLLMFTIAHLDRQPAARPAPIQSKSHRDPRPPA